MRTTATIIARSLSILGHPVVVIPVVVATLMLHGGASSAGVAVSVVCAVGLAVLAFSLWQVRRGRWRHVDASLRGERRSLNLFLAIILLLGAVFAFVRTPEVGLSVGLLMSGVLILVVMSASSWLKVSLHASFAAFAVALLWPLHYWYVVVASVAAAAVCWSRVILGRHSIEEVLVGSLLGAACGTCVWVALRLHG